MTLTELKYIVAVARERHFGRAAEACFVSQPTLSVAIKKLEDELAVQIFERGASEVSVTPVGEQIVTQAQRVLEQTMAIREIAKQGMDPLAGPLRLGVIYTIGPSYKDINRIWIGTDDGVIATTTDGGAHWANVTPPAITDFMKVFTIDAGRFDAQTAYAAVNTLRLDDMNPYIFRTHDFGATWTTITTGLPAGDYVHVVREDPVRRGMLYAGTQHGVYLSFDDGAHWQPLSLTLPDVPVVDLIVVRNDVVIATHGRGFYILDNVGPLRQQ